MAKSEDQIRREIKSIIRRIPPEELVIGITSEPPERLPRKGVDPNEAYIARANTSAVARRLEQEFLDKGMGGGPGGGTPDSVYVYIHRKKRKTR